MRVRLLAARTSVFGALTISSNSNAEVVHRSRGRVLLRHAADETCHLCEALEKYAVKKLPAWEQPTVFKQFHDAGDPATPFSGRMYRGRSIEDAVTVPESVAEAIKRKESTK